MVLSLSLLIGMTTKAQDYLPVEQNADGSYNAVVVQEAFKSYIDTVSDLPGTEEGIQQFVRSFLNEKLSPSNDWDEVVIRYGDEDAQELTTDEFNELSQSFIEILGEKIEQTPKPASGEQPNGSGPDPNDGTKPNSKSGMPIILVVVLLILALVVFLFMRSKKKKKPVFNNNEIYNNDVTTNNGNSDVIIRRKTNSIMYKQSLDDVVKDPNYMVVDCTSFCNNTAVKTMYIKNSCILDIYNMYAEDLRNPNNPKEDGCMVVGRWVHDEEHDEYAVSLEDVVFPGDDAVFAEYELDFGGKIKVKLNEKLRKLRRETNLQYDLTCWVHSHPGLGVFFSNTDCSLHLLHKHPTHPKFLTAIVIDILTPQQELGIFTFNHEMGINSKAELKQLFSLEEWYKWAVESKRTSVNYDDYFNALEIAKSRNNKCYNILLSNSVIIDIDLIANNQSRESLYFVHGFALQKSDQTTCTAIKIEKTDTLTDNELIGCFIPVTHRSYPTIKNAVANYLDKIKFVLVYSIADGVLTTIPIISNDLCADESYYGEQPLEELKIWTRRKR